MHSSHHHDHHQIPRRCCCCCCPSSTSSCGCSSHNAAPSSNTSDHLLQLLSAHLLLQQHQPQPQPQPHHNHLKPGPLTSPINHSQEKTTHQSLLHSLTRRIAALESSLPTRRPPSPQPQPPPPSPPASLRHLAARTIQSAFRRFLLRRSQTLRHLKRLAVLKSHVASLKSSLPHLDPKTLSHKATDLLLELDSIQSGDPMIREGRRSITRELSRMLEFIDKVLAREQQLSVGAMEIVAAHGSRPARRVSFARDESRVSSDARDSVSEGSDDGERRLSREVNGDEPDSRVFEVEDGEVDYVGWKLSNGEESPVFRHGFHGENGDLGLSAPLPVKMETRRGE